MRRVRLRLGPLGVAAGHRYEQHDPGSPRDRSSARRLEGPAGWRCGSLRDTSRTISVTRPAAAWAERGIRHRSTAAFARAADRLERTAHASQSRSSI